MSRCRRASAALIIASLAAILPAAGAGAASPGVNLAGPPTPELVQRAVATGAKSVRVFVLWRDLEPAYRGQFPTSGDHNLQTLISVYDQGLKALNANGIKPLYVLTETPSWANGSTDHAIPPSDPSDFAAFAGRFAAHNKAAGGDVLGYEIWNEADTDTYWHPSPSITQYTAILKASYKSIKAADPSATVVAAPTTGNNATWISQMYGAGAGGYFDAAAVHTDTACLVAGPDDYYRDEATGEIAQFSFLGYRTVRKVMDANGDAGKPILMSELGWSSTGGGPTSCTRGMWKGQKADGVSEVKQAEFLTKAFACLANDPYVTYGHWFTLEDTAAHALAEMNHYGLLRTNGTQKPAYAAFKQVAMKDGGAAGPCGDFEAPTVDVLKPAQNEQFIDKIDISSTVADAGVGMQRVSYTFDGGQKIRNFDLGAAGVDFREQLRQAPWHGAKNLALGVHTIEVTASDQNGNKLTRTIRVEKVASLTATLLPSFVLAKKKLVRCKKSICTVSGSLRRGQAGTPTIGGKVAVEWQFRNKKGKWRKLVGGLKPAHKKFTFKAKLKFKGRWRVRMAYLGQPPWKQRNSKFTYFRH